MIEKKCNIKVYKVKAMIELPEKKHNRHAVYVPPNYEDVLLAIKGVCGVMGTMAGTIIVTIDEPSQYRKIMTKCKKVIDNILSEMED